MSGGGRNESQLMLICGGKFSQKNMRIDHRKFRVHLQFNFIKFYCNMFHQFSKIKEEKLAKLCKSLRYQSSFFFANKQFFWNISLQKKTWKNQVTRGATACPFTVFATRGHSTWPLGWEAGKSGRNLPSMDKQLALLFRKILVNLR